MTQMSDPQRNLNAIHEEALREGQRRRVAKVREGRPEAADGDGMILAVLPAAIEQAHAEALIERAGLTVGDTVIVERGNPVNPARYRVARIDEVNAQALIQPLAEEDMREPWWIRVECLVLVFSVTTIEQARVEALTEDRARVVGALSDKYARMIPDPHPMSNCGPLAFRLVPGMRCPTCGVLPVVDASAYITDIAQTYAGLDRERAEQVTHLTAQRNALGTYIGCDGPVCRAAEGRIERDNAGHKLQGVSTVAEQQIRDES